MEGKKDSVRHSVSQSSRAVGKLDTVPGGGKDHSCHARCGGARTKTPRGWEVRQEMLSLLGQPAWGSP